MIVSYKYGFILVRTKKTASTSVELGLSTICGPDDIISTIGARQELLRDGMGGSAQNFHSDPAVVQRYLNAVKSGDPQAIRAVGNASRASGGYTGHMTIRSIKERVAADFYDKAYKFTTERHPYEKALSLAHFQYRAKIAKRVSFEDHLEQTVKNALKTYSTFRIYSIDGKPVMDTFLLQPTLTDDIEKLRKRLDLPPFELPRARDNRTDRRPATEVLTGEQKEFIYERCKWEFERFGWEK